MLFCSLHFGMEVNKVPFPILRRPPLEGSRRWKLLSLRGWLSAALARIRRSDRRHDNPR